MRSHSDRYVCFGKSLALMKIRMVIALLVLEYDVAFPPGSDNGARVIRDMKDQFTAVPGNLHVIFEHRS